MADGMNIGQLRELLYRSNQQSAYVRTQQKVRRLLISRDSRQDPAATGTLLPHPFDQTPLAIRGMLDEPGYAVETYVSRLASNRPDIEVVPIAVKDTVTATADKSAGAQERLDNAMWQENGGDEAQERCMWATTLGGVGFYLTLPRDADFGLPDRILYADKTDDEIAMLKRTGKVSAKSRMGETGKLIYAERGDIWRSRRREAAQARAIAGRGLFSLSAYPRDMVLYEHDRGTTDLKWAAIIEEVPSATVAPGTPLAMSLAKRSGVPQDDWSLYGIFTDRKGQIVGGIPRGGPINSAWSTPNSFVLIRFFDRIEQVVMVAPAGTIEGAAVVWRGEHGCTEMGAPACPVVEVPFYRTDVDTIGMDFKTPIDRVLAIIPQINQLLMLESNAAAFNGIPRWVIELKDGTTLRSEDGEPKQVHSGAVPGLDPSEAAAYPGTLKQLVIDTSSLKDMLILYFEKLKEAMPSEVTAGVAGASAPAYQVHQLIQQAQQILTPAANNHAKAVKAIVRRWHGWLRDLDVPIYFFSAPGRRANRRSMRSLVEFDPKNLSDSIMVEQSIDTPGDVTIRIQTGLELLKARVITYEDFFTDYARTQDARQAVVDMYVQMAMDYAMTGVLPTAEGPVDPMAMPLIKQIADGVRGEVHYEMIQSSPNYAIAEAEKIVAQGQQTQMMGAQSQPSYPQGSMASMPGQQGNVANAVGLHSPGQGMATSIQGQLGNGAPGAGQMPMPMGV